MHKSLLFKLLLSAGLLGLASTALEGRAGATPGEISSETSTDADDGGANADPPAGDQRGDDKPGHGNDKHHHHRDHGKRKRRPWDEMKARLSAREAQVDKLIRKLQSAEGQALAAVQDARAHLGTGGAGPAQPDSDDDAADSADDAPADRSRPRAGKR